MMKHLWAVQKFIFVDDCHTGKPFIMTLIHQSRSIVMFVKEALTVLICVNV